MRSFAALRMTAFASSATALILLGHDRRMDRPYGRRLGRQRGARCDRLDESGDRGGRRRGVLLHRVVAQPLEDLELGALDVVLEAEGVGGRDPAVLAAPDDERRNVEALERRGIERLLGAGAL